jgi:hypothetical protein
VPVASPTGSACRIWLIKSLLPPFQRGQLSAPCLGRSPLACIGWSKKVDGLLLFVTIPQSPHDLHSDFYSHFDAQYVVLCYRDRLPWCSLYRLAFWGCYLLSKTGYWERLMFLFDFVVHGSGGCLSLHIFPTSDLTVCMVIMVVASVRSKRFSSSEGRLQRRLQVERRQGIHIQVAK